MNVSQKGGEMLVALRMLNGVHAVAFITNTIDMNVRQEGGGMLMTLCMLNVLHAVHAMGSNITNIVDMNVNQKGGGMLVTFFFVKWSMSCM